MRRSPWAGPRGGVDSGLPAHDRGIATVIRNSVVLPCTPKETFDYRRTSALGSDAANGAAVVGRTAGGGRFGQVGLRRRWLTVTEWCGMPFLARPRYLLSEEGSKATKHA